MQFSAEAHEGIANGSVTVTFRFWKRPQVKLGGQYNVGSTSIEVDDIELIPFGAIARRDLKRAGLGDFEALRALIAHAGPVFDDTIVYRIEFHRVSLSGAEGNSKK